MTVEIGVVFAVILAALLLFISGRYPVDQVAVAIPAVLLATGIIGPETAVAGLSSPATVTVGAMLALSLGLTKTGAIERITRWVTSARGGPAVRLFLLCAVTAAVSPFLNNTAVVVIFLPVFLELARHFGQAPSRFLIPLSFSAILGGTVTIIGTSTNLIVYGMAESRGFGELDMFSIAPLGLIYLGVGFLYLFTLGRALLPTREVSADLPGRYDVRDFITELEVGPGSPVAGRTLEELAWGERYGVRITDIQRGERDIPAPGARRLLQVGDILIAKGETKQLFALAEKEKLSTPRKRVSDTTGLGEGDGRLVEVLVAPGSFLVGHTLGETRFQQRFQAVVLAIQHHGVSVHGRLPDTRVGVGDILLVHGPARSLDMLLAEPGFVPLGEVEGPEPPRPRALIAFAIMAGVVLSAGLGLMSILAAALIGVAVMVFVGCISLEEIYRELDWTVVFLLAGLIPLGIAMDQTGAAAWIGQGVAGLVGPLGPVFVVAAFYLVTSLLTEAMSNNAAAVVFTPIALLTAAELGMNPYALLVAVMFGASASFMTPVGYQTNTLIFGPGGYRFGDFFRVGAPLNLILLITASIAIPLFWPS